MPGGDRGAGWGCSSSARPLGTARFPLGCFAKSPAGEGSVPWYQGVVLLHVTSMVR